MWRIFVLICALASLANGQGTTAVNQCVRSTGPLPINTYIEGCITTPCLLPQLQDVVLHLVFRAPHTIRNMKTLATAFLFNGPIGIPYGLGEEENTCNYLTNTYCPVLKDEVITYTLRMFIEPEFFVNTIATIEFRIVDENDFAVTCIRLPIRITAPVTEE